MKRLPLLVSVLACVALASGLQFLSNGKRAELTNCAAAGSASQALAAGDYVMRVTDKDSFLCFATTCVGDAGEKWPSGTIVALKIAPTVGVAADGGVAYFTLADGGQGAFAGGQVDGGYGQDISCRSSDSTGDIIITEVRK